nr:PREDICTED: uncharacterized protein LOC662629 [Tribolium castaneum]|eukprot:XP_015839935.1 PREDICTED: uncharacterized protein LOC662629 [Tribolium castaneum]
MKLWLSCVGVFMLFVPEINSGGPPNDRGILSRRKRYVAFPDGSTLIWAFCMTAQTIIPGGIFTEGVNYGVSYDLPNRTTFREYFDDKKNFILRRRHRRDLYSKAEVIMDSMGFDGRTCIYRALCEAARIARKGSTLSEQLIRLVFKFPGQTISAFEPEEHRLYHSAYRRARQNKQQDCADMFPACTISLVDLALGYYNDYAQEAHQLASNKITVFSRSRMVIDWRMAAASSLFRFIIIVIFTSLVSSNELLSRKKRYLVFPEGSSLSIAICMTAQTGITPGEIFTEGINWGISYELPNDTKPFKELLDKPKEVMQRRHRRELYTKIETIMRSMGYNGRDCVLRALCEASRLKPKGESLVDEILRIVFRYPEYNIGDEGSQVQYNTPAKKRIKFKEECCELFPGCPFSLIDLALGYYSTFNHFDL